jgi:hypothetical protein
MHRLKDFFATRKAPDQFVTFSVLYMVPVIHELDIPWWTWSARHAPLWFQGLFMAGTVLVALNLSPLTFLFFAAISTALFLLTTFPENPNHITLLVYSSIVMMIYVPVLMYRNRPAIGNEEIFFSLRPVLRLILITLLFVAGFHKLNWDFLNPDVSCVNLVMGLFEGRMLTQFFGLPLVIYLSPVLAGIAYWLFRNYPNINIGARAAGWTITGMLLVALAAGLLLLGGGSKSKIIAIGAVLVLLWQLIEGPLLFVRKLQAPILIISIIMIGTISVSGVQIFPAALLPFLFAFVPDPVFVRWRNESLLSIGEWKIHSIYVCLLLNLLGASLVYITALTNPTQEMENIALAVSQSLHLVGVILLLVPLMRVILFRERAWKWEGVKVWDGSAPKSILIFPLLLFIWGMTPYFGLRTTGNFSMFSNVRTEGQESNHLLLGSNPLKVWGYQEDRVKIIEVDENIAKAGHHYDPLKGNSLPVVEFRKLVAIWRNTARTVPMTYDYKSGLVRTEDIVSDKNWATAERNWETFWLDFRPVQDSGPNRCRW